MSHLDPGPARTQGRLLCAIARPLLATLRGLNVTLASDMVEKIGRWAPACSTSVRRRAKWTVDLLERLLARVQRRSHGHTSGLRHLSTANAKAMLSQPRNRRLLAGRNRGVNSGLSPRGLAAGAGLSPQGLTLCRWRHSLVSSPAGMRGMSCQQVSAAVATERRRLDIMSGQCSCQSNAIEDRTCAWGPRVSAGN